MTENRTNVRLTRSLTLLMGGCLLPSFFLCRIASADTILLKNGKELKGLVVEQHADRIILSTEKGEIPILLSGIRNIEYDELEQNLMKIGKAYEAEGKLGEALAYYEKASEVNPELEQARVAAAGVRNRFWAQATEGPRNEVEKKQVIYDAWETGRPVGKVIEERSAEQAAALRSGLGIALEKRGDWVRLRVVDANKDAALAGLKKNDRLVSMDGNSLRYLPIEVVRKKLLVPKLSNFMLEFERNCVLHKTSPAHEVKDLGFSLKLEYEGLVVQDVKAHSPADQAGLKDRDFLTQVNGYATRYMPQKKVTQLMMDSNTGKLVLTVRRSTLLTRR